MNEYESGLGTTHGMWSMLDEILAENEEKLPESLSKAIKKLSYGNAMVCEKTVISGDVKVDVRSFSVMRLCPECGNKRCPRATSKMYKCTNSNEPGQPGSDYE